ncbi:uclacyanin 1 isoform X2 [Ricinus communis]|uniref:uclacyanin 1 isoform X2 n=1 Tax=Ricinus communis TaxID=3988 RepID=UPI00201B1FB6|nr:uclacyanin 1 isoform X2 [Ricinus communis]
MAILRNVMSLAVIAMLFELAMAANYTVGGSNGGWDTSTNLQAWAASQLFSVGDNLIFQYGANHNLFEVSQADYDSCQTSNAIQGHSDGSTVIPLSSPGTRYFICGTPGHCTQGMKVEIDVLPSSTPPPATPATPATPPPASPISPPPPSPSSVMPPSSSPSPTTSTPSPSQSPPETSPTMSPPSPPTSPMGSPKSSPTISPSPDVSSPPPSPSSANKASIRSNLTVSFSIVMMMMIMVLVR